MFQYLFLNASLAASSVKMSYYIFDTFFWVVGLSSAFLIKYIFIFSYYVLLIHFPIDKMIFQPNASCLKAVPVFGISSIITHSDD